MLDIIDFIKEFREDIYIVIYILIALVLEIYFRKARRKIKNELHDRYGEITETKDGSFLEDEFYIEYYKKIQIIDLIRIVVMIALVFIIVLYKSPQTFSFFAIAAGAIIITFKEAILSFLGFFFVVTNYKIGDVIMVGDNMGEIIYIKPFFVGAIGKDENGEHNGQFYVFPNSKFILEIIKKEEIKINNYKKEVLDIYYSKEIFGIEYNDFKKKFIKYLDTKFELKNVDTVGNYKTFIGYKYKLRFNYEKENIHIQLSFVEKPINSLSVREDIVTFLENIKK
ncbi:MAG: hypothetical protein PHR68_03615 [Candidatus Gracilibacteria bacterium]|nr:hypothetical protein [Candidatus Gracilibacteria bacterium]